ncbi:MAG: copper-binding protein [Candidatus Acidiferrales bacterium]
MLESIRTNARQRKTREVAIAVLLVAFVWGLGACKKASVPQEQGKRYQLQGKVLSVDPDNGYVEVDGKAIPGYMGAMAMPYPVADKRDLKRLGVGDKITADLVVAPSGANLENIVVTAKGNGASGLPGKPLH